MDIEFKVNHQIVKKINKNQPANLSQNYLYLSFTFETDDWNDLTKFALFHIDKVNYRVALVDGKALVPNACLQKNKFSFSLYGLDDEECRVTTNRVLIFLNESGYTNNVENDIPDDDPSIVDAIYLAIDKKADAEKVYTKSEVDAMVYGLNNKLKFDVERTIMQTGDTNNLIGFVMEDGMPKYGKIVNFYIEEED